MAGNSGFYGWSHTEPPSIMLLRKVVVGVHTPAVAPSPLLIPAIPSWPGNLIIDITARGDSAALFVNASLQFNGDGGANYDYNGFTVAAAMATDTDTYGTTSARIGLITAATATAGRFGTVRAVVHEYANPLMHKAIQSSCNLSMGSSSGNLQLRKYIGMWTSLSPINSIGIVLSAGNFAAGSIIKIYNEP